MWGREGGRMKWGKKRTIEFHRCGGKVAYTRIGVWVFIVASFLRERANKRKKVMFVVE